MRSPSISKNFIMNALLTMSSFIFPLITFPYVSRVLLPEGTGRVEFVHSFINYFVMISQLGIPTYGVRACAKVRENKEELSRVVQELLIINLIMACISGALLLLLAMSVPRLQQDWTLLLIMSSTLILNAIGIEWMYRGLEQYTYITIRSLIFKFISMVLTFVLIRKKEDYVIYGGLTIFAASASCIFNFINARKYIDLKPVGDYNFKKHFKVILVFFAMSCATTIYTSLDSVMLGFMKTDIDVGYYNAAVKIKNILVSIVTSLGAVLLPRASYYIEKGQMAEFKKMTQKALHFVLWISIPMVLYFILFAKEGILFLSGDAYFGSIIPMQIIMPTLLFIGITNVLGIQVLVPLGKEKIVLKSEIIGAVTDLVLNAILIPKLAVAGAAIGTLVAEFFVLIVQYFELRTEVHDAIRQINVWKIIIGIGVAVCLAMIIRGWDLDIFSMLIISAIVFFGAYFGSMVILKETFTIECEHIITNKLSMFIRKEK